MAGVFSTVNVRTNKFPISNHMYVFAYGSNLHVRRMRSRVQSARPISIGFVTGRSLRFHKRSIDGSAKADAVLTNSKTDRVWGAIYRIAATEKPVLDQFEYLGIGYDEAQVSVVDHYGNTTCAWMYFARREAIDSSVRPFTWYRDFVLHGAFQHRLPFCYITSLVNVETWQDPDVERHARNRQLIDQ